MVSNCSQKAANWWSDKIEAQANRRYVPGLDKFEKLLAIQIQNTINSKGSAIISTSFSRGINTLERLAFTSNMKAPLPVDYDMNIFFGNIYIYYNGILISSL